MPIEIEIRVTEEGELLVIDGHDLITAEVIKNSNIVDWLEAMGYITIKITEE